MKTLQNYWHSHVYGVKAFFPDEYAQKREEMLAAGQKPGSFGVAAALRPTLFARWKALVTEKYPELASLPDRDDASQKQFEDAMPLPWRNGDKVEL
jgi:hypothetical protein